VLSLHEASLTNGFSAHYEAVTRLDIGVSRSAPTVAPLTNGLLVVDEWSFSPQSGVSRSVCTFP